MAESAQRVPEHSATYQEFARLYDVARRLRPTGIDRWNGELYATSGLGGFDQRTGAIGVHEPILREGLSQTPDHRRQAHALATVLHRATHAGMDLDAPREANAVRTNHSLGIAEGFAAVRATNDFTTFSELAGYEGLVFDEQQHTGAYAATTALIAQAAGPRVDRRDLINRLSRGPAVMQFDRLAEGVVRNRLEEVVPGEGVDRRAVRGELIGAMLHPRWEELARRSPEAGRQVAEEIGRAVNSKVDEIRHRFQHTAQEPAADGVRQRAVEPVRDSKQAEVPAARFLNDVAPAAGATGERPSLGDGSRAAAARASAPGRAVGQKFPRVVD
ncbi:hypothetical protein ACWF0M_16975 [Kribbella sp. NPDC055110]